MNPETVGSAYAPIASEVQALMPPGGGVIDAHTHLGRDEDGQSLDVAGLLRHLDEVDTTAQACVFPFHDPERRPAYRTPNDRVLRWAAESDGRLFAYCRLDPADDPVREAERCLELGARGIKLHPRAQAFGFGAPAAAEIFAVARDAGVPILVHAGRGMTRMDALADVALRFPEVPLVLAHAAIADQGMFSSRLSEHPAVLYDTSCFSPLDVVELFARVPAERIVFASDVPYGRPTGGLHMALRAAAYAGLDAAERSLLVGGTMRAVLEGSALPEPSPPRLAQIRRTSGRLARVNGYLLMGFAAALGTGPPPDVAQALPGIALARGVCRDPDPGVVGPALERIDAALAAAERCIEAGGEQALAGFGLLMAAGVIAGTEPIPED